MEKKILNLGCGKVRIPGTIGVDRVAIEGYVDIVHDLDLTPYPFESESIDEIHLYHVLEHLQSPLKKLEELHRILKVGGRIYLRVPHFSSMGAFTDVTHVRPFGAYSFDCLEPNNYQHFYTTAAFRVDRREIKYLGLYPNTGLYAKYVHSNQCPWIARPFVRLVNFLIALSPMAFERVWGYWVGGATEAVFELVKVQPKDSQ